MDFKVIFISEDKKLRKKMYNLAIDVGNSNTDIGIFSKKLLYSVSFPTYTGNLMKEADKVFNYLNRKVLGSCAISSVVPEKENFWYQYIKIKLKVEPLIINNRIQLPINIKVKNTNALGTDRVCNAICGYEYFKKKKNVIVIDMGTAITYDVVNKNGDFVGGIIALGIGISAKALNFNTGKLPQLSVTGLSFPKSIIGRDTRSAMQSGLMYTVKHAMEGTVKAIEKETKRNYKVILTGGFSRAFINKLNFKPVYVRNAVLEGLNRIIEYNK